MSDSRTNLGVPVSGAKWIFDLSRRRAQYVRLSDGFVLESRVMTRDEVQRAMSNTELQRGTVRPGATEQVASTPAEDSAKEETMETAQERNSEYVGKKIEGTSVTVLRLAGKDPRNSTQLVDIRCECGKTKEGVWLYDYVTGRKKYCNGLSCPLAKKARAGEPSKPTRAKRAAGVRRGPKRTVAAEKTRRGGAEPKEAAAPAVSHSTDSRAVLTDEAAMLRKMAAGIVTGSLWDLNEIATELRSRANTLDELIYAGA